jgi:hypothetical protein
MTLGELFSERPHLRQLSGKALALAAGESPRRITGG